LILSLPARGSGACKKSGPDKKGVKKRSAMVADCLLGQIKPSRIVAAPRASAKHATLIGLTISRDIADSRLKNPRSRLV
jgi:hypothetical protein